MKEKINLLISIGLGAILGWILGFLRLPALENKFSFSLGFIACLTIILLGFLIVHVWNKTANSSTFKKKTVRSISTLSLILLGGFASSFLFFQQNKFFKIQKEQLNSKLAKQFELEASTRKSNSLILINNLLDKIQNELNSNPKRILSEETIERITTLNYSFEPYRYFKGEKFSKKKWSPERGQLLLSLTKMKIDSSSFNYLKLKNSFFGADLSNANLVGADLSHVDLREALLDHANLTGANLNQATLEKASLQKVNLSEATLNGINLKNAEMQWTEFQAAELIGAFLNGANMSNSKLRKVNLSRADLRWANLSNVFLNEANLTNSNLLETDLSRANLKNADFTGANLITTVLIGANLKGANLTNANLLAAKIDENWLEKLETWQVTGAKEIQSSYKIGGEALPQYKFRLNKIKK